jgi:hypothetical protein
MGIDHFSGISKTTKQANDFNKKQASGKDVTADSTQVLSLSAKVSAARAKIQNSKQSSLSLSENFSLKNNQDINEKKNYEGPKIKPQAPITQTDHFQEELKIAEDSLGIAKKDVSKRMDEAVLSGSGEDIASLRGEYKDITDAQELIKEEAEILKDPSLKDPDLIRKIQNKRTEITSLTLNKGRPGNTELLGKAKEDLVTLKAQLFSQ